MSLNLSLKNLFSILLEFYGPQNWWPVDVDYHNLKGTDPRDEIIIGAILTQNTSWRNVEKALLNFKVNGELSLDYVRKIDMEKLKDIIRPAGYFNQKAFSLKNIADFLKPTDKVKSVSRGELLSLRGIGNETADVILLYAGDRLSFVIDKYTQRLIYRVYGIKGSYNQLKAFFEENLPRDLHLYKEFHALIDEHAKRFCKKDPLCNVCVLRFYCKMGEPPLRGISC